MSIELTLTVEPTFVLPSAYSTATPQQTAQMLSLGALAFESIQSHGAKQEYETLYQTLQTEAAKQYTPKLQTLEKQLQQQTDLLTALKQRLIVEEASRLDTEKRVREEERRNREELLGEKDRRIEALQASTKAIEQALKESSRSLTDGFQSFKEQMLKTNTGSSTKGKQGEIALNDMILKAFGSVGISEEFTLEDVGKEGHQGDLIMRWKGHKVLWEVKNYSDTVKQKEVTKFHRDMEENRDIQLGIMVSLHTAIVGHHKTGHVDLEELRDGRKCIYIHTLMRHEDPVLVLQSLKPFMELFLDQVPDASCAQQQSEEHEAVKQVERFEAQRTIMLRLLNNHQEFMRKFKNSIANAKKKSEQQWNELASDLREAEHHVKLLLETMLDKSFTGKEREETSSGQLPSYVFQHTDLEAYGEKERQFVVDTIALFDFDDEAIMTAKIVKDCYKELKYSEEQVNALRPKVFAEGVWEKGSKDVRFFKRRN